MAKFDSVLLGKSTGSIGNVTTSRLKGQNIAKAKITATTNVNSAGQVESRSKMSNIVLAWQFLSIFLVNISALRKSTESNYNAFVRGFKSGISDVLATSRAAAAGMLDDVVGLLGNFVSVALDTYAGTTVTVELVTGGLAYSASTKIRVLSFIEASGEQKIVDRVVTEAEWLAGSIVVLANIASADHLGIYVYDDTTKKCSNVVFTAAEA